MRKVHTSADEIAAVTYVAPSGEIVRFVGPAVRTATNSGFRLGNPGSEKFIRIERVRSAYAVGAAGRITHAI